MKEQEYQYELNGQVYKIHGKPGLTPSELHKIATGQEGGGWFDKNGRTLLSGVGAGLGMVAAAPAAVGGTVLSGGLATPGAIALEAGAAGLGAGIGSQAFDVVQTLRGRGRMGETPISKLKQVAGDVGVNAIAAPAGRAIGEVIGIGAKAAAPYVAPKAKAALDFLRANSGPGVQAVRGRTAAALERETGEAAIARATAQDRAAALRAQGQSSRTAAAGFERKAAKAQSRTTPPTPTVGEVKTLSERGAPVREATVAARSKIYENQVAQDKVLRDAADQVVADNEAAGKFISDLPSARSLLDKVTQRTTPNPGTSPTATALPTPEEGKILNAVQTAIKDRRVIISEAEARAASEIDPGSVSKVGGKYVRTFKTNFEALDNLRRRLGESFNGVPSGFEGIPTHLARDMYGKVSRVLDDYVGTARADVQANWKAGLQALEPYDNTRLGKALSGVQGETSVPNTFAANVPGTVIAGGREAVEQVGALGGAQTQKQFLSDEVQAALVGPDGAPLDYDAAIKKLGQSTKLGDALNADPELKAAVQQHLQRLNDAKLAGTRAEAFTGFGKARTKAAETAEKGETAAIKEAAKAERIGLEAVADFEQLKVAKPKQVLNKADAVAKKLLLQGKMTQEEYGKFLNEIAEVERTMGVEKARNRALTILGASSAAFGAALFGVNRTIEGVASQTASKIKGE
jgi:hypothetical protein